jgi:signal transduction histidine kinase/CheY-like chemotaxis protein
VSQTKTPSRPSVAPPLSGGERRAAVRHPFRQDLAFRLTVSTAHQSLWARARDISTAGIGLSLPGPVTPGNVLLIEVRFKAEFLHLALLAEVTHNRPQPDGSWVVGCTFDNLRGDLGLTERQQVQTLLLRGAEGGVEPDAVPDALALLAHRLYNPLASVRNAFSMMHLRRGLRAPTDWEEWQDRHLVRRMEDFFDLFRLGRGKLRLHKELLDFADLMVRARDAVQPFLEARQHKLTVVLPPEPLRLEGDPARLERMLCNLLEGAIKFSAPGGDIRLAAGRAEDWLVLRLWDTSSGMAVSKWRRILEASTSSDVAQGEPESGLTLVRDLVEMHGGNVEARSIERGRGSEVIVRLPAASASARDPHAGRAGTTRQAAEASGVLIVDHNRDAAEGLATLLQNLGRRTRVAADAGTAVQAVLDEPPQVVFVNLDLPLMDGYQVVQWLRAQPAMERALFVALIDAGRSQDRQHSPAQGFARHLFQPVDRKALNEVLAAAGTNAPAV